MYHSPFFVGMEFMSSLSGWFWHSVFPNVPVTVSPGTVTWGLDRAGDSLPVWLTHLSVVRRPQLLALYVCPQGSLSVLVIWQMASPKQVIRKRKAGPLASSVMYPQMPQCPNCYPGHPCSLWGGCKQDGDL